MCVCISLNLWITRVHIIVNNVWVCVLCIIMRLVIVEKIKDDATECYFIQEVAYQRSVVLTIDGYGNIIKYGPMIPPDQNPAIFLD